MAPSASTTLLLVLVAGSWIHTAPAQEQLVPDNKGSSAPTAHKSTRRTTEKTMSHFYFSVTLSNVVSSCVVHSTALTMSTAVSMSSRLARLKFPILLFSPCCSVTLLGCPLTLLACPCLPLAPSPHVSLPLCQSSDPGLSLVAGGHHHNTCYCAHWTVADLPEPCRLSGT